MNESIAAQAIKYFKQLIGLFQKETGMKIKLLNSSKLALFLLVSLKLFSISVWAQKTLNPTIYYIKTIDLDQNCSSKKTIYSQNGKSLFKVCKESYNSCVIEGTCAVVKDGDINDIASEQSDQLDFEILNYVKSDKNGLPLFVPIDENRCPYGLGVKNICLDPYYTVAADLNFHQPGDVLFIPTLKGIKLPNGDIHKGYVVVRDRGGAIKGADRFDFYTGFLNYKDPRNPFTPLGFSNSNKEIPYRKANESETKAFLQYRNFPLIPQQ